MREAYSCLAEGQAILIDLVSWAIGVNNQVPTRSAGFACRSLKGSFLATPQTGQKLSPRGNQDLAENRVNIYH